MITLTRCASGIPNPRSQTPHNYHLLLHFLLDEHDMEAYIRTAKSLHSLLFGYFGE